LLTKRPMNTTKRAICFSSSTAFPKPNQTKSVKQKITLLQFGN
jgi:hypothetical protein